MASGNPSIAVRLKPSIAAEITTIAEREGTNKSRVARELIEEALRHRTGSPKPAAANGFEKDDPDDFEAAVSLAENLADKREHEIQRRMAADKPAFSQQLKRKRAIKALEKAGLDG
jgi:hypothetical protein